MGGWGDGEGYMDSEDESISWTVLGMSGKGVTRGEK